MTDHKPAPLSPEQIEQLRGCIEFPDEIDHAHDGCAHDALRLLATIDSLRARCEAAEADVARLNCLRFLPIGDNHHNAAQCPYCRPDYEAQQSSLRAAEERVVALESALRDIANANVYDYSMAVVPGDIAVAMRNRAHQALAELQPGEQP